jgi:hypothetical protein
VIPCAQVYTSLCFLYLILKLEEVTVDGKTVDKDFSPLFVSRHLGLLLTAFSVLFSIGWVWFPSLFLFFFAGYSSAICLLLFRCYKMYHRLETPRQQRRLIIASSGIYLGGFVVFWLPDCELRCCIGRFAQSRHAVFVCVAQCSSASRCKRSTSTPGSI